MADNINLKIMMKSVSIFVFLLVYTVGIAQEFTPNYDESKIPDYTLPPLLTAESGKKIKTPRQWENVRRPEIINDFTNQVYGKIPGGDYEVSTKILKKMEAFDGQAILKEARLTFSRNEKSLSMDILMFLPKSNEQVPLFVGLNFYGNHTINDNPNITIPTSWIRNNDDFGITNNQPSAKSRGVRSTRWPVKMILDRGYGLATIYYGDIDPDKNDFSDGIHALFYDSGQTKPAEDEWGSITAWSWGLSRAMDYFEEDENIDAEQVALMGHSRLGKTSLWAGAMDKRFAIVISNDSGCGGAALSRRRIGETVGRINDAFPHWFCDNFVQYSNNEDELPVDQHMLIALIAPRPVYVASAKDDRWADPKGEYLSAFLAGQTYDLYGLSGLPSDEMPAVNQPIHRDVGYHIRTGGHDVKDFDWEAWMDFADKHFEK
jgi:hypothetical protein